MSRAITWTFVILLVLPLSFAFDCDFFEGLDGENCKDIASSNLPAGEQDRLVANLLHGSSTKPDFDVIRGWNLDQDVVRTAGAETASGTFAKDVWLDQLALMPSIVENDILYCPGNAEVLTGFGYDIVIPPDYYADGYPDTKGGDCRTEYNLQRERAEMSVFADGELQGSGTLVSARIDGDSVIESKLDIEVSVEVKHYEWYRWCCSYGKNGCERYCNKCKYDRKETQTDTLRLSDSTEVKLYNVTPIVQFEVNDQYYGTTKGQVSVSNYSTFELGFQDSSFKKTAYNYEAVFSGEPNYIVTLHATPDHNQEIRNLYLDNNTFYVKNTNECEISAGGHFNTLTQECDLTVKPLNETEEFEYREFGGDLYFFLSLCIFLFIMYVIYRTIMHYWGRLG